MTFQRDNIIRQLKGQIEANGHIVGVAAGSGMTTKMSVMGGADFVLALSAGRFRQMGRSSLASFLCYANSNDIVMDFASRELLPLIQNVPVLFGINAGDPSLHFYEYLGEIKRCGFAGINNFPTVGLIDGQFRQALEEDGCTYDREVEAIRLAHFLDLFTVAYVFDEEQAAKMIEAGADVICAHLGLTTGGMLGAKRALSLEKARQRAERVFAVCDAMRPGLIKMIYGGPIKTPADAQYFYKNTSCQGFVGGSSFERIPSERAILNTVMAFKTPEKFAEEDSLARVLRGEAYEADYIEFTKTYVSNNYMKPVLLGELAALAHVSPSHLSTRFKRKTGRSFTQYLVDFRMEKACELMRAGTMPLCEVAESVGYPDYAQFSKMFKKHMGYSPTKYVQMQTEEL